MMHGFGEHAWGMGWFWIVGLIILIIFIWTVVRSTNKSRRTNQDSDKTALDILKERYARGEIDKAEFEERKKDL